MTKGPFRKPNQIENEKTVAAQTRIKVSAKAILEKAAKEQKISFAWLIGRVLEDYAQWIKK